MIVDLQVAWVKNLASMLCCRSVDLTTVIRGETIETRVYYKHDTNVYEIISKWQIIAPWSVVTISQEALQ